jgi:hypothetical protein
VPCYLAVQILTSGGSTINSAAAALLEVGALRPVAVTIGRQIRPHEERFKDFVNSLEFGQPEDLGTCALEPELVGLRNLVELGPPTS